MFNFLSTGYDYRIQLLYAKHFYNKLKFITLTSQYNRSLITFFISTLNTKPKISVICKQYGQIRQSENVSDALS